MDTFQDTKTIGLDIIRGCLEIIKVRNVITRLMQHCEKISKDMENIVSYLTKRSELEQAEEDDVIKITKQPSLLSSRSDCLESCAIISRIISRFVPSVRLSVHHKKL